MIWGESICVQVMLQRVGCWSSSKSFIMAFAEASIHSYSFVTRERRVPIKNILVIWSFHETFGAYIYSEMKQQITQDREDLFLVWSEFWFLTLTVVVCSKNGLVDFQGRDFRTSFQKSNKVELPCSEEPNLVPRVFSFSNITLTPTQSTGVLGNTRRSQIRFRRVRETKKEFFYSVYSNYIQLIQ